MELVRMLVMMGLVAAVSCAGAMSPLSSEEMSAIAGACPLQNGPCLIEYYPPECCYLLRGTRCGTGAAGWYEAGCAGTGDPTCYEFVSEQELPVYECAEPYTPCPCFLVLQGYETVAIDWCEDM